MVLVEVVDVVFSVVFKVGVGVVVLIMMVPVNGIMNLGRILTLLRPMDFP